MDLAPLSLLPALQQGFRAAGLGALAAAFGTLLIMALVRSCRPAMDAELSFTLHTNRLAKLAALCAGTALIGHAGWLAAQAAVFADATDGASLRSAMAATVAQTRFGQAWALRLLLEVALLVATLMLASAPPGPAAVPTRDRIRSGRGAGARRTPQPVLLGTAIAAAATALALQVRAGHAAAAQDWLPAAALALHVVAASAWIGSLPALLVLLMPLPGPLPRSTNPDDAVVRDGVRQVLGAFSRAATAVVIVVVATGLWQASLWIGGPVDGLGGWLGTDYGRSALAKMALTLALLALAAIHRWGLAPRLHRSPASRLVLLAGIGIELCLGLATFAVAAHLAAQPPAVHEQPVWPYPLRPDWQAWSKPYARRELGLALAWLTLGLAAAVWLVLTLARRGLTRSRRAAWLVTGGLGCATLAIALDVPNVRVWLRPAYTSSFQHSPTGYGAASIARGAERVQRDCRIDCFLPEDDATDLSPYNIWGRADGDLYGWLLATFDTIGHSPFAHGYIGALEPLQRWELVDYFRARVASRALDADGRWRGAFPVPDLPLDCHGQALNATTLRGGVLRIVAPGPGAAGQQAPSAAGERQAQVCFVTDAEARIAYATLTGLRPDAVAGSEIVADANGWLRQFWGAAAQPDAAKRQRVLQDIQTQPLPQRMARGHVH
ncbi:MAG: hypothetical protein GAK30_02178 [Paracidovorax wautersii]|uniref:Copper resistance protein D domain-containing protein n=1 Tax=Paracidovorax wautersii TaxID=1177982 RepID=A0A7V8FNE9_9BURK|nr:MAG: hypothetical protein GAK30_02178 [Paracidovorax wautersii]